MHPVGASSVSERGRDKGTRRMKNLPAYSSSCGSVVAPPTGSKSQRSSGCNECHDSARALCVLAWNTYAGPSFSATGTTARCVVCRPG
jgi:hypothetical protein